MTNGTMLNCIGNHTDATGFANDGVIEQVEGSPWSITAKRPGKPCGADTLVRWFCDAGRKSKVKQILRSLKARTADALEAAVAEALAAITPENAINATVGDSQGEQTLLSQNLHNFLTFL